MNYIKNEKNFKSVFRLINKNIIFSVISYLLCSLFIFLISLETDYTDLKNGEIVTLLFFSQLILILANIIFINSNVILKHIGIEKIQKVELSLRFIIFLIMNINLRDLGINLVIQQKLLIILFSVSVSSILIVFQYIRVRNIEDLDSIVEKWSNSTEKFGSNIRNVEHISLRGIVFYAYSVITIVKQIGNSSFGLNIAAFCYGIFIINKKLKIYYSNTKQNNRRLYIINSGLIIGFVLNLAGAVVLHYYNHISIKNFMGIKDLMFIVAMMSTMPLLKEYSKQ